MAALLAPQRDLSAPSFFWRPPAAGERLADQALDLARLCGIEPDPWQELAVRAILAQDVEGLPVAFEAAIIVSRQNGKGTVLEILALAWLFLTDTPLILWSAHLFKTAAEAFRRIRTTIQKTPFLLRRVAQNGIRTSTGQESIELRTGQRLFFVARSKGSGRGLTGSKIILDEAYELPDEDIDAMLPTLTTMVDAQVVYTSSAGMATSAKLRSLRDRGRRGGDPALAYVEYGGTAICPKTCPHPLEGEPGAEACKLNDRDEWRAANPAPRVRISFIAKERRALSASGFARERLGIWDEAANDSPITVADWRDLADLDSVIFSESVLAIDCSPGLRSAAVVAAGWREDGHAHVEVIRHEAGVEWVVDYVRGVYDRQDPARIVLLGNGPARALLPDLQTAGDLEITVLTETEAAAACVLLEGDVRHKKIRHLGDPILSDALAGAERRDVGDGGWTWRRKTSTADICPFVAVTAARWALASVPLEPSLEDLLQSFG